jgi:hypothetical protein
MFPRAVRLVFLLLPLCFAACRDAKVSSYRVPKEKDPEMTPVAATETAAPAAGPFMQGAGAGGMAGTPVATASGPGLAWTAPAHWVAKPAAAMRKATYAVPGNGGPDGDLSITAFPSDVGGELANVNRWRGQVQLAPLAEAGLAGAVTRLEQNGLHIAYVDFSAGKGADSPRLLGAIVPFGGGTWFFKLSGPDALLAKEKGAFEDFLRTLKPAASP